jgi:hypothetical protein
VPGRRAASNSGETVEETGLRHVTLVSLSIALLFLLAVFTLEFFKPRLSVRAELSANNTVVVTGRLTYGFDPVPNQFVAIEVLDRDGVTVWRGVVRTLADGSFRSVFTLNASGSFKARADSGIASAETGFEAG